jgi:AcrR family transcriptional regulator
VRRKPRVDAQRNRDRILESAREAFTQSGANASLDDIAKEASVGPGTLYRHFPTRHELLEAVYRTEVEMLAAAQRKFAEIMPPMEALRAWMLLLCRLHCDEEDHRSRSECAGERPREAHCGFLRSDPELCDHS